VCTALTPDQQPRLIFAPELRYPEELLGSGQNGLVILRVVVDTNGKIQPNGIHVDSTSDPRFTPAAIQHAILARFDPAHVGARAVRAEVRMPIQFAAPGRGADVKKNQTYSCVPKCEPNVTRPRLVYLPPTIDIGIDAPADALVGQRLHGLVIAQGIVDVNGRLRPQSVRIVSATSSATGRAVEGLLRNAEFEPGSYAGQPVPVTVEIRYECALEGANTITCHVMTH